MVAPVSKLTGATSFVYTEYGSNAPVYSPAILFVIEAREVLK